MLTRLRLDFLHGCIAGAVLGTAVLLGAAQPFTRAETICVAHGTGNSGDGTACNLHASTSTAVNSNGGNAEYCPPSADCDQRVTLTASWDQGCVGRMEVWVGNNHLSNYDRTYGPGQSGDYWQVDVSFACGGYYLLKYRFYSSADPTLLLLEVQTGLSCGWCEQV